MSQQAAEHFKIAAVDQIKSSERVTEQMRVKPLDTRTLLKVLKNHLYNVDVNAVAAAVEEKGSGNLAGTLWSCSVKVALQTAERKLTHGNKPLLAAFTVYKNALLSEIHIGNLRACLVSGEVPDLPGFSRWTTAIFRRCTVCTSRKMAQPPK